MKYTKKESIAQEVFKHNELLKHGLSVVKEAKQILKPFLNKKVCKVDESLTKAVKEALTPLNSVWNKPIPHYYKGHKATLNYFFSVNYGELRVDVKIWYSEAIVDGVKFNSCYSEQTFYIGKVTSQTLESFIDDYEYKTLNAETEYNNFVICQRLLNHVIDIKNKLNYRTREHLSEVIKCDEVRQNVKDEK